VPCRAQVKDTYKTRNNAILGAKEMHEIHNKEILAFNRRQEEMMAKKEYQEFMKRENAYIAELMGEKHDNYEKWIRKLMDQR